jgi:hypothetical protein
MTNEPRLGRFPFSSFDILLVLLGSRHRFGAIKNLLRTFARSRFCFWREFDRLAKEARADHFALLADRGIRISHGARRNRADRSASLGRSFVSLLFLVTAVAAIATAVAAATAAAGLLTAAALFAAATAAAAAATALEHAAEAIQETAGAAAPVAAARVAAAIAAAARLAAARLLTAAALLAAA